MTALRERSRLYNAIMYAPRGLDRRDREIAVLLDLVHVVAVFAWANRLMLTLGEPR